MQRHLNALSIASFVLAAAASSSHAGQGTEREQRPVSGFDRVVVHALGELIVKQGEHESLSIEAERDLLPKITAEVKDGTLYFDFNAPQISTRFPIRYHLSVKSLSAIQLGGSASASADKLDLPQLEITLTGSSRANIGSLAADRLVGRLIGAGAIEVRAGSVTRQVVSIEGAGTYSAANLASQDASIAISGSGDARVAAEQALAVQISGSGSVRYTGNPKVRESISGAGRLIHAMN